MPEQDLVASARPEPRPHIGAGNEHSEKPGYVLFFPGVVVVSARASRLGRGPVAHRGAGQSGLASLDGYGVKVMCGAQ